jgi:hypothetical protein
VAVQFGSDILSAFSNSCMAKTKLGAAAKAKKATVSKPIVSDDGLDSSDDDGGVDEAGMNRLMELLEDQSENEDDQEGDDEELEEQNGDEEGEDEDEDEDEDEEEEEEAVALDDASSVDEDAVPRQKIVINNTVCPDVYSNPVAVPQ